MTYSTKDGAAFGFDALEFLAELSCHTTETCCSWVLGIRAENAPRQL